MERLQLRSAREGLRTFPYLVDTPPPRLNWIDRALAYFAPMVGLRRIRARAASAILARHYEGAASGRRTQGWNRSSTDANAAATSVLQRLRDSARDLVRNNGYAESALTTICDHVVGWGIVAKPEPVNPAASKLWKQWAGTTACDADGRNDFAGLQHLVMRTVAESGECLVRKRLREPKDGLPIPLQLQVLEPDYLDTSKMVDPLPNKGKIVAGVEFDAIGRRVGYWLFQEHPGAQQGVKSLQSVKVGAEFILHIFRKDRPGQIRGVSWFAPVLLKFKDFDDFDDATLMTQKVAACLSIVTTDVDGTPPGLGTVDPSNPTIDGLEPGGILNLAPGRDVKVVQPPTTRDYEGYTRTTLRAIATGLGVTYEDLTGDYSNVNFSSARMGRLKHQARVEGWRWRVLIPQFCAPVWVWAMELAGMMEGGPKSMPVAKWTAPPLPMIDPANEGLAYKRNIRAGVITQSEAIRERGYDPDEFLAEYAADNRRLDALGIVLDSDARKTSDAGLTQARPSGTVIPSTDVDPEPAPEPTTAPKPKPKPADDEDEDA
jgi:lambda family phage portal protein